MSALSVKLIPTLIHYTRSFEYMMVMKLQSVKLIPTRNWRNKNFDLVVERDKNRKKSQQSVDECIHYMWFNYLQLCLDLESINHSVPKRGGRGKIISTTKVKVSKSIYKDWDLEKVKNPVLVNGIKIRNIDYFSMTVGLDTPDGHNIIPL